MQLDVLLFCSHSCQQKQEIKLRFVVWINWAATIPVIEMSVTVIEMNVTFQ